MLEILFRLDPIGVHQDNAEKFVPEAISILIRLRDVRTADDVEQIVLEELRRWYGRRRLANHDPERVTDATIAICSASNHFLEIRDQSGVHRPPAHQLLRQRAGNQHVNGHEPRQPTEMGRCWHTVIARDRLAQFVVRYITQGRLLYVASWLTYRPVQGRDAPRQGVEILAAVVTPVDRPRRPDQPAQPEDELSRVG